MRWTVALFLAALSGCAGFSNFNGAEKIEVSKISSTKGILIVSAGADRPCNKYSTSLYVERAGKEYPSMDFKGFMAALQEGAATSRVIDVDGFTIKSDFGDHQGTLNAVDLEAGDYQIFPVKHLMFRPVDVRRAYVTVVAGKVLYLGEVYLTQSCELETAMIVRDQKSRDLKLLQAKNPELAAMPVETTIIEFADHMVRERATQP